MYLTWRIYNIANKLAWHKLSHVTVIHRSYCGWLCILIMIRMAEGGKAYSLHLYLSNCCPQCCQALLVSLPPIHRRCYIYTHAGTSIKGFIPLHLLVNYISNRKHSSFDSFYTTKSIVLAQPWHTQFCYSGRAPNSLLQNSARKVVFSRVKGKGGLELR